MKIKEKQPLKLTEKKNILKGFIKFFLKKIINEMTLNVIKEMFPNNQEINHLIDDFNLMNGKNHKG